MDRISKLIFTGERDSYKDLPGPAALPYLGLALQLKSQSIPFLTQLSRTYGDLVRFPMPGIKGVLVSDPEFIKLILAQTERNYYKGKIYDRARPLVGNGLVTNQGLSWRKHRKLANPVFTEKSLTDYEPFIRDAIDRCIDKIRKNSANEIDSTRYMMDLTFDIVAKSLFSSNLGQHANDLARWFKEGQDYLGWLFWAAFPLPLWIPTQRNKRFKTAKTGLVDFIKDMIRVRRGSSAKDDLFQKLIDATDDESNGFSEEAIIDEVLTLMIAGHDTTALTLSYGLYALSQNPEAARKLRTEVKDICGDMPVTLKHFSKMKYLRNVLQEIMRLYPAVYMINRTNKEAISYKGMTFNADTTFFLSQYAVHRHPKLWNSPDEFIPERWDSPESIAPGSFFPFGGGPRTCIGNHLAMFEAGLALPEIVRYFKIESTGCKFEYEPNATMTPNPGVHLRFKEI